MIREPKNILVVIANMGWACGLLSGMKAVQGDEERWLMESLDKLSDYIVAKEREGLK